MLPSGGGEGAELLSEACKSLSVGGMVLAEETQSCRTGWDLAPCRRHCCQRDGEGLGAELQSSGDEPRKAAHHTAASPAHWAALL